MYAPGLQLLGSVDVVLIVIFEFLCSALYSREHGRVVIRYSLDDQFIRTICHVISLYNDIISL